MNNSYQSADIPNIDVKTISSDKKSNAYGQVKDHKFKNKSHIPAYDSINNSNILVDGDMSINN